MSTTQDKFPNTEVYEELLQTNLLIILCAHCTFEMLCYIMQNCHVTIFLHSVIDRVLCTVHKSMKSEACNKLNDL